MNEEFSPFNGLWQFDYHSKKIILVFARNENEKKVRRTASIWHINTKRIQAWKFFHCALHASTSSAEHNSRWLRWMIDFCFCHPRNKWVCVQNSPLPLSAFKSNGSSNVKRMKESFVTITRCLADTLGAWHFRIFTHLFEIEMLFFSSLFFCLSGSHLVRGVRHCAWRYCSHCPFLWWSSLQPFRLLFTLLVFYWVIRTTVLQFAIMCLNAKVINFILNIRKAFCS